MRRRRKTRRKTGSRAPQLRKQTDRATPASTWRSSILEHDENLIPEESNGTREKAFIDLFRRTRCLKYSVIWHPITEIRNHPFSYRNISVRSQRRMRANCCEQSSASLRVAGLRLSGKGLIAPGMDADIDVFTLEGLHEAGTYQQPRQLAQGMEHVFVAGEPAILHGKRRPSFCGKVLERVKF